jgi:hypothetical protein
VIAFWSLAIGCALLALILSVGLKGVLKARDLELESSASVSDHPEGELPTMELAEKIFSPVDGKLIDGLRSAELSDLFQRERSAVALLWVRHTSRAIHQVMREHAEAARASRNLEFWTELKLFRQYLELRLTCGMLYAAIQLGGPLWLRGLAIHAQELSRRIADAQASFQAARVSYSPQG